MINIKNKTRFAAYVVVSIVVVIVGVGASIWLTRPPLHSSVSRCKENLRNIQVCKELWANDNSKTTNDIPSWNDLRPYFPDRWSNNVPVCPSGGAYTIGRVGEPPKCSIGGYEHSLP